VEKEEIPRRDQSLPANFDRKFVVTEPIVPGFRARRYSWGKYSQPLMHSNDAE